MQLTSMFERSTGAAISWRNRSGIAWKIAVSLSMAGVIGLLAQLRIPLPFSPVPLTGQTFGVLLAGVILGKKWGGVSVGLYAILGFAGIPWFNGSTSGFGATSGYLLGFVLAALFIGYKTDGRKLNYGQTFGWMLFASTVLIYVPGLIWLGLWLNLISNAPTGILTILTMGAIPFLAGDVIKASIAVLASKAVSHRA
jgi:biotin transport system substrate-specific component